MAVENTGGLFFQPIGRTSRKVREAWHLVQCKSHPKFWYALHVEVDTVETITDIISGHENRSICRVFHKNLS